MKYRGRVKGHKTCVTNSTWVDNIVLSKMNRYFWGGRGRREGMEKQGVGRRMNAWEKRITEEGTRAWGLGGQLYHDKEFHFILKAVDGC